MVEHRAAKNNQIRIRPIALPAEHGGWGFLSEPILLGLLVAPSVAGALLAVSIVAAFLVRQPLKMTLTDRQRGRSNAKTRLAWQFAALYGAISILAIVASVWVGGWQLLLPLAVAAPFGAVFAAFDFSKQSRSLQAELAGSVALAISAASIAVAGGWLLPNALALWGLVVLRAVPSVLYVRARLKLDKGKPAQVGPALIAHLVAIAVAIIGVWGGQFSGWVIVPFVILFARAGWGLSAHRPAMRAKMIGFSELGLGFLTVFLLAAAIG